MFLCRQFIIAFLQAQEGKKRSPGAYPGPCKSCRRLKPRLEVAKPPQSPPSRARSPAFAPGRVGGLCVPQGLQARSLAACPAECIRRCGLLLCFGAFIKEAGGGAVHQPDDLTL